MKTAPWAIGIFLGIGIISFAIGFRIGRTFVPEVKDAPIMYTNMRPPAKELNMTLGVLMNSKPEELEQVDTATMYLASLAGLPGNENVDLEKAHAHFADLAKLVQSQTDSASKYQHSLGKDFKDTPETKALALVEILREYEVGAIGIPGDYRPEELFMRNHSAPEAQLPFNDPRNSIPNVGPEVIPLNNPLLVLEVGRLLGYPLYLVKADDHIFVRWQSADGKTRFNIDEIGKYDSSAKYPIRPDSDYVRPPESQVIEGGYFKSLTKAEMLAFFLQQRGHNTRTQQQWFESELAFTAAHRFDTDTPVYREDMLNVVGEEMRAIGLTWKDFEKNAPEALNLNPPKPDNSFVP